MTKENLTKVESEKIYILIPEWHFVITESRHTLARRKKESYVGRNSNRELFKRARHNKEKVEGKNRDKVSGSRWCRLLFSAISSILPVNLKEGRCQRDRWVTLEYLLFAEMYNSTSINIQNKEISLHFTIIHDFPFSKLIQFVRIYMCLFMLAMNRTHFLLQFFDLATHDESSHHHQHIGK